MCGCVCVVCVSLRLLAFAFRSQPRGARAKCAPVPNPALPYSTVQGYDWFESLRAFSGMDCWRPSHRHLHTTTSLLNGSYLSLCCHDLKFLDS